MHSDVSRINLTSLHRGIKFRAGSQTWPEVEDLRGEGDVASIASKQKLIAKKMGIMSDIRFGICQTSPALKKIFIGTQPYLISAPAGVHILNVEMPSCLGKLRYPVHGHC